MSVEDSPKPLSLAKRITGYAANVFVSSLILLAGLVFGRQVLEWWHAGPPPISPTDHVRPVVGDTSMTNGLSFGWLEFGDSSVALRRVTMTGDLQSSLQQLRKLCRQAASARSFDRPHPKGTAEKQLLKRIADQSPIEQEPGKWNMYQHAGPVPLVVVVDEQGRQSNEAQVEDASRRVICWGLAFSRPASDSSKPAEWILFVCAEADEGQVSERVAPATPPNAVRLLALTSADGAGVCSWRGTGPPVDWKDSFDRWHAEHGWTPLREWNQLTSTWHRRYEHPSAGTADVQFAADTGGALRGYWLCYPKNRIELE